MRYIGYCRIDDADPARNTPGVIEYDTVTCGACNTMQPKPEWALAGGWSRKYDMPLCLKCAKRDAVAPVVPFEKRLDEYELITAKLERERAVRAYGA